MAGERATKMLILSSARTLFSEKGYDETPVEEICALAGVAKGTFFYHFESKQYIVRYIMALQLKEFSDKLREQMETFKDAVSKVEYYFSALIESDVGSETRTYFKGKPAEWFKTVMNEERMSALYPLLEEVVDEGIDEGFFKVKHPQACTAIAFLGIDGYMQNMRHGEDIKQGIREITAKTLGIKETGFAI